LNRKEKSKAEREQAKGKRQAKRREQAKHNQYKIFEIKKKQLIIV